MESLLWFYLVLHMVYGSEFIPHYKWPMDIQVSADILEEISFEPRGAPLSNKERKELNLKAGRLIKSRGIYMDVKDDEYEELRELGGAGYAHYYLQECWDESELKNKADVSIYKQLLEIDSKLGTTQTEQLFKCVVNTVRMDLIKV